MTESSEALPGVSPLDRAHALRLAGDTDAAVRLCCAILDATPSEVGAGQLVARVLIDAGRGRALASPLAELLQRSIRRGDMAGACMCAQLRGRASGETAAAEALTTIAEAFGTGSSRLGVSPTRPPPLPVDIEPSEALRALTGAKLLDVASAALMRLVAQRDPVRDAPLPTLPLFGALAPPALAKLLAAFELRECPAGETVVRQGELGLEAFWVARGMLNVVREETGGIVALLAVLGPGAFFGEMALVSSAPRAASVVAVEPTQMLVAQRGQLELLAQREPAIGRELAQFCQQRMLANLLRHSYVLSAVAPAKRAELIGGFATRTFKPGQLLVKQGDESGSLFVIASGGVEVRSTDPDGDRVILAQPGPGDVVGEISLVLRRPAVADVIAIYATVALELTRDAFHATIREYPGLLQQLYEVAAQREEETRSVVGRAALDVTDNVLL
jgi:CRP-like cAMP-binding protein